MIDTHEFLWLAGSRRRISAAALRFMEDRNNALSLSVAGGWGIAIKFGRGRLELDMPLRELLTTVPRRLAVELMPIEPAHLVAVADLPDHHRDPFDRLMAAQCLTEGLPIVSRDNSFDGYGVRRIW